MQDLYCVHNVKRRNYQKKRKATSTGAAKIRKTLMLAASFSGGNHIELDFNLMDGPRTRAQGLCKHENIVLTRQLVFCR